MPTVCHIHSSKGFLFFFLNTGMTITSLSDNKDLHIWNKCGCYFVTFHQKLIVSPYSLENIIFSNKNPVAK